LPLLNFQPTYIQSVTWHFWQCRWNWYRPHAWTNKVYYPELATLFFEKFSFGHKHIMQSLLRRAMYLVHKETLKRFRAKIVAVEKQ